MIARVLIVDDNDDHRFLTRRAVRSLGPDLVIDTETATGGAEALARLQDPHAPPIDLVLLDLKMPGIDGIETLRRLRADERTRTLRVILFSSTEHGTDKTRALAAGADEVVTKPVSGTAFHECVRDTVKRHLA